MGGNHSASARALAVLKMSILHSKIRGAALMLALWALFLLSAMIISWALDIDSHLTVSAQANRILEAEAMACSGAEVALHPSIKPGSPNLTRRVNSRESYEARITGEGGRLNLHFITGVIIAGDPAQRDTYREILRKYLKIKGIDMNESDHMIDCLLDWIDPDNLVRLNGAEESEDYHPANRPLRRIDELKEVKGWAEFTSQPGWDADFTLSTNSAKIDPNWASREVLLALPGMTEAMADNLLQMRRGPDGIDGTQDDVRFKNNSEVAAALGLNAQQFKKFEELIDVNDPVLRVVSVGKSGNTTRVVQMVFTRMDRMGSIPQIKMWKEL